MHFLGYFDENVHFTAKSRWIRRSSPSLMLCSTVTIPSSNMKNNSQPRQAKMPKVATGLDAPRAPYTSERRPSAILSRLEFAFFQRRDAGRALFDAASRGWASYCFALSLIDATTPLPDRPVPDLTALTLPWDQFCSWYRDHQFEDQLDLFLCSEQTELDRWLRFTEQHCFKPILQSPQLTRSLLRATGMLPTPPDLAASPVREVVWFLVEINAKFQPRAGYLDDTRNLRNTIGDTYER